MSNSLQHRRRPRVTLSAAVAVLALGALAACGSDTSSTAGDTSTSASSDAGSASTGASADPSAGAGTSEAPSRTGDGPACSYSTDGSTPAKAAKLPPEKATITGTVDATIETSIGTLAATLDAQNTPCTVNSFVSLADQGYFDDTTCHRLTTSPALSVLQCGDPSGTGRGGPGYSFDDELTGEETYPAGTLAMANAGENTNGSQFFVVYADSQLPPSYAVFGTVDAASVALVAKAAEAGTDGSNGDAGDGAPITPVDITSVTVAQ